MRIIIFISSLLLARACPAAPDPGFAGPVAGVTADPGVAWLARVDADFSRGDLGAEEALLLKLAYVFEPGSLPPSRRPDRFHPLKCATSLVAEYGRVRDSLSPQAVAMVEAWLAGPDAPDKAVYLSPSGRFRLTYATTGDDAVPLADALPANGVPDFVERVAGYCDAMWALQVQDLGFAAPPVADRYDVGFESMSAYGYTMSLASPPGATRMMLHNTFQGFPPNTDPEGPVWGAAKVTVAHEFKHATQYAASRWSEGEWIEADATWMEDIAYDAVNDFYNYLPYGSPISSPGTPLDGDGSGGSYEDCIWQHWLSETWGLSVVQDFWSRRASLSDPFERAVESYDHVLQARGASIAAGWPAFTAWNYATGTRAATGFGYGEAPFFPTGPATSIVTTSGTATGSVARLAAAFVRYTALTGVPGFVRARFTGADGALLSLAAVILRTDGTAVLEPVRLNAANDADVYLPVPREQMAGLGFVVGNGDYDPFGPPRAYSLAIDQVVGIGEPLLAVSADVLAPVVAFGARGEGTLTVTNGGDPGSILDFTVAGDPPVPWLAVTPAGGRLAAGESVALALAYDAGWLAPGEHAASLRLSVAEDPRPREIPVTLTVTAAADGAPFVFRLRGNRPNPFNPITTVEFSLPRDGPVLLEVFDARGRRVRTLWRGVAPAGPSAVVWDGRDDAGRAVASGAYLLRMSGQGGRAVRAMLLAR